MPCMIAGEEQQQTRSAFAGDLHLDGLRVNQLKLSRNLTGTVLLSDERFQIKAKVSLAQPFRLTSVQVEQLHARHIIEDYMRSLTHD